MTNRWNTEAATCPVCAWQYTRCGGKPETCPACERKKQQAEIDRVLKKEAKK